MLSASNCFVKVLGVLVAPHIDEVIHAPCGLSTLLPYLAVSTRRLHDVDRSGWWQLIGLVPFVGWIMVIYWLAQAPKPATRFTA